jgi:pimeloyl-ACP methyl ester carboxylesterase
MPPWELVFGSWFLELVSGGFFLLICSQALAQNESEKVVFETVDEVELHGTFYPSGQGMKAPCVVLLHDLSGNAAGWNEWASLTTKLRKNGFAVLQFDFRGYGKSATVRPAFWKAPDNSKIRGASLHKSEIDHRDFPASYLPVLTNDIAAARRFLDEKNDAKQCNTRNLILIGAQEGATLGSLWLATEWQRRPPRQNGLNLPPYGEDVAAAVWLSILPTMGHSRRPEFRVDKWLGPLRDRTPMFFLYGEEDRTASSFTIELCDRALRIDVPPRPKSTGSKGFKTSVAGAGLFNQRSLGVEDKILTYLSNLLKARDNQEWMDRGTKRIQEDFVNLRPFGLPAH